MQRERAVIDLVFTDPPYGMNLDTNYSTMNNNANVEFNQRKNIPKSNKYNKGYVDDFDKKFIENILNLNVNETFLWGADYYTDCIPDIKKGSWIVWDKRSNENFTLEQSLSADKAFGSCFELCWSKTKHKREIARIRWAGVFGTEKEFDKKRHHPTQKPIELSKWFIMKFSDETDKILDLFGGSGTTLIACEQLNRNCYMMELDPYYCQVIINRWENFTGEKAVKIN